MRSLTVRIDQGAPRRGSVSSWSAEPSPKLVGCGMAHSLTDGHDDRIAGVLLCYDRLLITGTVSVICYAEGMTRFLYANGIRIFDYPKFAASWAGAHHLGRGSLRQASAVARQGERQEQVASFQGRHSRHNWPKRLARSSPPGSRVRA